MKGKKNNIVRINRKFDFKISINLNRIIIKKDCKYGLKTPARKLSNNIR
jgi:hypothetical protein